MKLTNLSKLLIKFIGGGLVNFPTRYLKEVEVEAEGGENDGGGSGNNDDELISNAKMAFANFVNNDLEEDPPLYTEDDVELPDKYIYINDTDKEIYEVGPYGGKVAIPLYLKNRNLTENNIVLYPGGPGLSKDNRKLNLDTMISDLTNKTSLNLSDYIWYRPDFN